LQQYLYEQKQEITIDNISIKCDNIILGAKIITLMRCYGLHDDDFSFEDCNVLLEELDKIKPKLGLF